jgi:hypothetical protein
MNEQEEFEFRRRYELEQAAKAAPQLEQPKKQYESYLDHIAGLTMGGARGIKNVIDTGAELLSNLGGKDEAARVKQMNAQGQKDFEKNYGNLPLSSVGKFGGEVVSTLPVGGAFGKIAEGLKASPAVVNALRSGGMSTGAVLPESAKWLGAKGADMALRTAAGGLVGAGAGAAINPDEALFAGGVGALMPGVFKGVGAAGGAVGSMFKPTIQNVELAKKAISEYGIPLGVSDISKNSTVKALRSILNDAPFTGGIGANQREVVQQGFNQAVGKTFGAESPKLTPEVLDAAKKSMGAEFDRLWGGNVLRVDDAMVKKVAEIEAQAAKMPKHEGQSLLSEIADLKSKISLDDAGNAVIDGETANKFQSYLRKRAEGASGMKGELSDLRQTIIGAFNRSVAPEDAAALAANMGKYKSFKTVEPLLNKGEAGVAGRNAGDVPASLLPSAVAQNYSKVAGSPLADLSRIGSHFVMDRVPQTGGSARAAIQNSALGAGLAYGGMANPLLAAAVIPSGMGLNKLLGSPAMARKLLSNNPQMNNLDKYLPAAYRLAPAIAAQ